MEWSPYSTDLNPTENLLSVLKSKFFLNGMQFNSKSDLGKAIQETSASLTAKGDSCINLVSGQEAVEGH